MDQGLPPQFEAWIRENPHERIRLVVVALALFTSAPVLVAAGYLLKSSRRLAPDDSRRRVFQVSAVMLAVSALMLVFFLWRLFSLLNV